MRRIAVPVDVLNAYFLPLAWVGFVTFVILHQNRVVVFADKSIPVGPKKDETKSDCWGNICGSVDEWTDYGDLPEGAQFLVWDILF